MMNIRGIVGSGLLNPLAACPRVISPTGSFYQPDRTAAVNHRLPGSMNWASGLCGRRANEGIYKSIRAATSVWYVATPNSREAKPAALDVCLIAGALEFLASKQPLPDAVENYAGMTWPIIAGLIFAAAAVWVALQKFIFEPKVKRAEKLLYDDTLRMVRNAGTENTKSSIIFLTEILKNESDDSFKVAALKSLGALGEKGNVESVAAIRDFIGERISAAKIDHLVKEAVFALSQTLTRQNPEAFKDLRQYSSSAYEPFLRETAMSALERHEKEYFAFRERLAANGGLDQSFVEFEFNHNVELLDHSDLSHRASAIRWLGWNGGERAIDHLAQRLNNIRERKYVEGEDEYKGDSDYAVESLARIARQGSQRAMDEICKFTKSCLCTSYYPPVLYRVAIRVLGENFQNGNDDLRSILAQCSMCDNRKISSLAASYLKT